MQKNCKYPLLVEKRDGTVTTYDRFKIKDSINKACISTNNSVCNTQLLDDICKLIESKIANTIPKTCEIRALIIDILIEYNLVDVLNSYMKSSINKDLEDKIC